MSKAETNRAILRAFRDAAKECQRPELRARVNDQVMLGHRGYGWALKAHWRARAKHAETRRTKVYATAYADALAAGFGL